MTVVFKGSAFAALGLALSVTTAQAATLGLATTGPVDTGSGDLVFFGVGDIIGSATLAAGGASNFLYDPDSIAGFFDSGADVASIEAYGFAGEAMEFKLSAFDSYTNGALLIVDVAGSGLSGDIADAIALSSLGGPFVGTATYSVQALAGAAAVPLPAGFLLLGTALGGLGFARKRRAA